MTDDTPRDDGRPSAGEDRRPANEGRRSATDGDRTATDDRQSAAEERADAASPEKVDRLARRFEREGRPYARVTVVRRESPVSANVGDRALVTSEGDLVGWIGGAACAQSVVAREATEALRRGEPVLVGLAPDPETLNRPGLQAFPMTCHSGGTLELFVEPVTPTPRVVVFGDSQPARALARLASDLTYEVIALADAADLRDAADSHGAVGSPGAADRSGAADVPDGTALRDVDPTALADAIEGASFAVVAGVGDDDEVALEAAIRAGVPYVGLVASERRAAELIEQVAERTGRDPGDVAAAVSSPAGVDIGARTPEEIAVSILAELVSVRRSEGRTVVPEADAETAEANAETAETDAVPDAETAATDAEAAEAAETSSAPATVTDPVCGMDVRVGEAAATVEFGGETYHFCGQGCADAFEDDPDRFLRRTGEGGA